MRTVNLFLVITLLCLAAFGQNYHSISDPMQNTVQIPSIPGPVMQSTVQMPSHPQPITRRSLFAANSQTSAQGERPAYEILDFPQPRPLGDVARDYRREHEKVKKAAIVWAP